MDEELHEVQHALNEASVEVILSKKQSATALKQLAKLKISHDSTVADFMASETIIERLEEERVELKSVISEFEELKALKQIRPEHQQQSLIATKQGVQYSPVIRRLYYSLLANQIPAARAAEIVKAVLKCFLPDSDVETIKLPSERCAGYMRKDELKTISNAHKVSVLFKQVEMGKQLHLNSDGTTKHQHKINGTAINGIVISVNEVPDGTAESIINDIDLELKKNAKGCKRVRSS